MNQADLANLVGSRNYVNAVLDKIAAALRGGEEVRLQGFGTFSVIERAGHTGRHPRTGKIFNVPARLVVKFKPSPKLLNGENK